MMTKADIDIELPSDIAIEYLHRRLASDEDIFERVFTHCAIVWNIAQQLIRTKDLQLDARLVKAGALLHDVGVYRLVSDDMYIRHGLLGAKVLKDEGYPPALCRFAACHTGVGLTAEDIRVEELPLPPHDFVAKTAEERLIMYADKFHSKTSPPQFNNPPVIKKDLARFGDDKIPKFKTLVQEFGTPDLEPLAVAFSHKIV